MSDNMMTLNNVTIPNINNRSKRMVYMIMRYSFNGDFNELLQIDGVNTFRTRINYISRIEPKEFQGPDGEIKVKNKKVYDWCMNPKFKPIVFTTEYAAKKYKSAYDKRNDWIVFETEFKPYMEEEELIYI